MWLPSIQLPLVLRTCHRDFLGDWYRDPWGWPEMEWVANQKRSILEARLSARGAGFSCLIDVPKENFAIRPAAILDPVDRLAYQTLVGRASKALIGKLDPNVFGWRLPRKRATTGRYASNKLENRRYRSHLTDLASGYQVALKTDIVSYFASIPIDRLCDEVTVRLGRAGLSREADRLVSFLQSWDKVPGRGGLPQRCQASSVLANMYLTKVDDILARISDRVIKPGVGTQSFARWMDDIWIFGDDAGELRMVQVEIQRALESMGLHLNVAKTTLFEGNDVEEQVQKVEHSAIDGALLGTPARTGPLNALINRVIQEKETANRTTVRFMAERMKTYGKLRKLNAIVDVAPRIPHAADHLGRLFRDSKRAVRLQDWFLDYQQSPWAKIEWPKAQFATMFPSENRRITTALKDYFADSLADSAISLPMIALTAQRLAAWNPALALSAIENAVERVDGPLERRVLALAGLNSGASVPKVREWLSDFPENAVTLNMLEDMSFNSLPYEVDFAGD